MTDSSSKPSARARFRPVLSEDDISHIISLAKADGTRASILLLSKLVMFEYKIQNATVRPAYKSPERASLSESMGFETNLEKLSISSISPEALYNLWLESPQSLTIMQIQTVRKWRYDHDKMTVDEEKEFEREVLGIAI